MDKTYEWTICNFNEWTIDSKVEYINDCCKYCDVVIHKIMDDVCDKLKIDSENIEIGQEDWGWYFLLQSENLVYRLDIGHLENSDTCPSFYVYPTVQKLQKVMFFKLKKKARTGESARFIQIVNKVAEMNGIKIS